MGAMASCCTQDSAVDAAIGAQAGDLGHLEDKLLEKTETEEKESEESTVGPQHEETESRRSADTTEVKLVVEITKPVSDLSAVRAESASLKEQLGLANAAKEQLERQLQEIAIENHMLSENVAELSREVTEQKKLREETAEKVSAQAAKLLSLSTESKTLQDQLDEANVAKEQLQEIEASNASLLTQAQIFSAENSNFQHELQVKAQLEIRLHATEAENLVLSENVAALNREAIEQKKLQEAVAEKAFSKGEESLSLKVELKTFQEQLEAVNTNLGLADAEKERLRSQLQASEIQNLTLSESAAALSTQQTILQQKLQQEAEKKTSAEAESLFLKSESKTIKEQLVQANIKLGLANTEKEQLLTSEAALQKKLQQESVERASVQTQLASLNTELKTLQDQLGQANFIKEQLQSQLREKEVENLSVQSGLQQRLATAQSTLSNLSMEQQLLKNSSPVKKYPGLKVEHQELQQGFKVLQAELQIKTEQLNDPMVRTVLGF